MLNKIALMARIPLSILVVLTLLFGCLKIEPSPETEEQREYRLLYHEFTADDVLTEKEMKQLDEAYKRAFPDQLDEKT